MLRVSDRARTWRRRAASLLLSRRTFLWTGGILAGLVIVAIVGAQFAGEPLRRLIEKNMNASLIGYSARVDSVKLHIFGLWTDVRGVTVRQDRHPEPPVIVIPQLTASVQWRAILHGKVVADCRLQGPAVHLNLPQLSEEAKDNVSMDKRGWQDALQAIYPLKINELTISDGALTYQGEDDPRPLEISHLSFLAQNIRNVRSREGEFPSTIKARGIVFDHGHIELDGRADFFLKPFPGVEGELALEKVELEYFQSVARHINLRVKGGELGTTGRFVYAPEIHRLELDLLTIDHAVVDYLTSPQTVEQEARVKKAVATAARDAANDPTTDLVLKTLRLNDCEVGFVSENGNPAYRLFVTGADVEVTNLTNRTEHGEAKATLAGSFMGSGAVRAHASFLPEGKGPNFQVAVEVDSTELRTINNLLLAYGKFDVVAGSFSLFSEITVRDGWVNGYVKPLFKDIDVYDARQDRHKNFVRKTYEAVVGGLAKILRNRKRKEVATVTSLSGPLNNTQTNAIEVILGLLKNAYLKSILPGFEDEAAERLKAKGIKPPKPQAKVAAKKR